MTPSHHHAPPSHFLSNLAGDTPEITPISDVNIAGFIATVYLNCWLAFLLYLLYELLRRSFPTIYYGAHYHKLPNLVPPRVATGFLEGSRLWTQAFRTPWADVLKYAGLDYYMFLRYIRMCYRICLVSSLWVCTILCPLYYYAGPHEVGWYRVSLKNVPQVGSAEDSLSFTSSNRLWVSVVVMYLLSLYTIVTIDSEYKHYLELRMSYLSDNAHTTRSTAPNAANQSSPYQSHYSVRVENIPPRLRSERALASYFGELFPGKVHSASLVLSTQKLTVLRGRRLRVCRRFEKSYASLLATSKRPTHVVGRKRCMCCGIESQPLCNSMVLCLMCRGRKVDSLRYYKSDLKKMNRQYQRILKDMEATALKGERVTESDENLLERMKGGVMGKLGMNSNTSSPKPAGPSSYGSFDIGDSLANSLETTPESLPDRLNTTNNMDQSLLSNDYLFASSPPRPHLIQPGGGDKHLTCCKRFISKIGGDFVMEIAYYCKRQFTTVVVDSIFNRTVSSTGFVTFTDLQCVSICSSMDLTYKNQAMTVTTAPGPSDIFWDNAHISEPVVTAKTNTASFIVTFGALLWSVPVATIQGLATTSTLAKFPGMGWLETLCEGCDEEELEKRKFYANLVNGYLPVITLLGLMQLLPLLFEWLAKFYENRKTNSDIQRSILRRFFYYQLANVYVSITAASILDNLSEIIDSPSSLLSSFSEQIPAVVGYFISLLCTKILAGLPVIMLRLGALLRMGFLRCCFKEPLLTMREMNEVYRKQEFLYGWEYPTQLFVIVICFTYSIISPIILPVGAVYFFGALMVYKMQAMHVYTAEYESGGDLFPSVCHRTLVGLTCGQLTLLGYVSLRVGLGAWQPFALIPLPIFTLYIMNRQKEAYDKPSEKLSLERATVLDNENEKSGKGERIVAGFDEFVYRQPLMDPEEREIRPMDYREGRGNGWEEGDAGRVEEEVEGEEEEEEEGESGQEDIDVVL